LILCHERKWVNKKKRPHSPRLLGCQVARTAILSVWLDFIMGAIFCHFYGRAAYYRHYSEMLGGLPNSYHPAHVMAAPGFDALVITNCVPSIYRSTADKI